MIRPQQCFNIAFGIIFFYLVALCAKLQIDNSLKEDSFMNPCLPGKGTPAENLHNLGLTNFKGFGRLKKRVL